MHPVFQRFFRHTQGSLIALFAIGLMCLVISGALAVDYANFLQSGSQLQNALDAAALSASVKPNLTTANVDSYGKILLDENAAHLKIDSSTFTLGADNIVYGEATIIVQNSFTKVFGDDKTRVTRKTAVTRASGNLDVQIFLDTSLTMGLPAEYVANSMELETFDPLANANCFFSCHDDGAALRGKGYTLKADVVAAAIGGMIDTIQASMTRRGAVTSTFTLHRFRYLPFTSLDGDVWKDYDGINPIGDITRIRDTTVMDTPVGMTLNGDDIKAYLSTPVQLSGSSNLNVAFQWVYDVLQWKKEVQNWVAASPYNSITDTANLFASITDRSSTNRFFKQVQSGTYPNPDVLKNMARTNNKTVVIFISDGDHRRASEPFDQKKCDAIKALPNTEVYTLLVYNNPQMYVEHNIPRPMVDFDGSAASMSDPNMIASADYFGTIYRNNYTKIADHGLAGLAMFGYTVGLYNTENLMRGCATDDAHFYKGEFENEINTSLRNITDGVVSGISHIVQ